MQHVSVGFITNSSTLVSVIYIHSERDRKLVKQCVLHGFPDDLRASMKTMLKDLDLTNYDDLVKFIYEWLDEHGEDYIIDRLLKQIETKRSIYAYAHADDSACDGYDNPGEYWFYLVINYILEVYDLKGGVYCK